MRFKGNRDNWTYAPDVSELVGRWVGYKTDPMQKIRGINHYIAGIVRSNGRLSPNTCIGRGDTPEFALSELLRNNNISVTLEPSEEKVLKVPSCEVTE